MRKKKLREILRGYRYLQNTGNLRFYRDLKSRLAEHVFSEIHGRGLELVFNVQFADLELALRQRLFDGLGRRFQNGILCWFSTKRPLSYPLPTAWQEIVIQNGVGVNRFYSTVLWYLFCFMRLLINVVRDISYFFYLFFRPEAISPGEPYVHFLGLQRDNLPKILSNGEVSYDICSWYGQYFSADKQVSVIAHDVRINDYFVDGRVIRYSPGPWGFVDGFYLKGKLFLWWCMALCFTAISFIKGRWFYALLLSEATRAKAIEYCPRSSLARMYFFHWSGSNYRPLWTYSAQSKGSELYLYFYSHSAQPKTEFGYESLRWDSGVNNWPNILVWNENQREGLISDSVLSHQNVRQNIIVAGPIWFVDGGCPVPELPGTAVAVFPVERHRITLYRGVSTYADWHTQHPDFYERFCLDIKMVMAEYGLIVAWKDKRDIGARRAKKTSQVRANVLACPNVVEVPSSVSALRLTESCVGMISMPFTSTALYRQDSGFPSIYYDPTGWIQRDDRAASGIKVVSGLQELRAWVATLVDGSSPKLVQMRAEKDSLT